MTITPTCKCWHRLLEEEPQNRKECAYQNALHESYNCEVNYKSALFWMQSTVVLQSTYCDQVSSQLAVVEEKWKKQKMGKLNADGLPKLLTGDAFRTLITKHDIAAEKEKAEREN
ncbi:hypothetical protein EDC04DRAFT_2573680 [Pisolithus marmoratus]|nr:hypothetical protein EDC04DRAFT_2573680 [Pisolithus marmoratus]